MFASVCVCVCAQVPVYTIFVCEISSLHDYVFLFMLLQKVIGKVPRSMKVSTEALIVRCLFAILTGCELNQSRFFPVVTGHKGS